MYLDLHKRRLALSTPLPGDPLLWPGTINLDLEDGYG